MNTAHLVGTRYRLHLIRFLIVAIVLFASSPIFAAELGISPDTVFSPIINDTITFEITVSDVESLFAFGCDLSFNPQVIEITEVIETDFLCCSGGDTVTTALTYSIDEGNVVIGLSQLDTSSSGASTVAAIPIVSLKARIVSFGTTELVLSNSYLLKPDGVSEILHTLEDGLLIVEYPSLNTSVAFDPADTSIFITQQLNIALTIDDIQGLFGFSADITYPEGIVRIDSVAEGPFLSVYGLKLTYFANDIDTLQGRLLVGGSILSFSDTGVATAEPMPLAYIYCTALQYADSSLTLEHIALLAPDGVTEYPISSIGHSSLEVLPTSRVIFQPDFDLGKDSYVLQSQPAQNFGIDSLLYVTSGSSKAFSLIQFSIDGITSEAAIAAAELMTYSKESVNPDTIGARSVLSEWYELLVTWDSLPDTGAVVGKGYRSSAGWWSWDVKEPVQQWISGVVANNGFLLSPLTSNSNSTGFYSNDYTGDFNLTPKLVVDFYYPPTCPDLVIAQGSIEFSQNVIIEGDEVLISARVYNTGFIPVYNVLVRFYQGVPIEGRYELVDEALIPYIGASDYKIVTGNWNTTGLSGDKYIFVWADPENAIEECNSLNNKYGAACYVYLKPDLRSDCQGVVLSNQTPAEGETLSVAVEVSNDGEGPVNGFNVELYVGEPLQGGILIGVAEVHDTLTGGARDTLIFQWNTTGFSGGHDLFVALDASEQVPEQDENNNIFSCNVNIYNPSLSLTTQCPTQASPNDTVDLSISVQNLGIVAADSVIIILALPQELSIEYSSVDPDSGYVDRWTVGHIEPSSQIIINLKTLMSPLALPGSIIDITTTVEYGNIYGVVQNPKSTTNSLDVGEDITPPQVLVNFMPSLVDEDTVALTCTPSETLFVSPNVVVTASDGDTLALTGSEFGDGTYTYKLSISDSVSSGRAQAKITAQDLAGNVSISTGYFTVDHDSPSLSVLMKDTLSLGIHTLRMTSSEHLIDVPAVSMSDSVGNDVDIAFISQDGIDYDFQVSITDSTAYGCAHLIIGASDLVGNVANISESVFVLNDHPAINIDMPNYLAKGASQFEVSSDRALGAFPDISGYDNQSVEMNFIGPVFSDSGYVIWTDVTNSTAEGMAEIFIRVVDTYGNWSDTTVYSIVDRSGPTFQITPDTGAVTLGTSLQVFASEPLSTAPELAYFLGDAQSPGVVTLDSSSAETVFFYTFTGQDTVAWFTVTGTDSAGNDGYDTTSYLDLRTEKNQITFSDEPGGGYDVSVSTFVHNEGYVQADSVTISFWSDIPNLGQQIGEVKLSIPPQDSVPVEAVWPDSMQTLSYVIFILVDPYGEFAEFDENNNASSKGSFSVVAFPSKPEYVKDHDSLAVLYCRLIDINNWSELNDTSSITVVLDIIDSLGEPILSNDTLLYSFEKGYYLKAIDLTESLEPNSYLAIFQGDIGGGSGIVADTVGFEVLHSASITCDTDWEQYHRRDTVTVTGNVVTTRSEPFPSQAVEIYIQSKGGTRRLDTETDSLGYFSKDFVPTSSEAGEYLAFARTILGTYEFRDTAEFIIDGVALSPSVCNARLSQNSSLVVEFSLSNVGVSTSFLDSITVEGAPFPNTGIQYLVDTSGTAFSLAGGSQTSFSVEVEASPLAVPSAVCSLEVFYNDSMVERSVINVLVDPARPIINTSTFNLMYKTVQGQTLTKRITMKNDGYTAWRDIRPQTLIPSWLTVSFPSEVDSLPVGQEVSLDFTVSVPDTMSVGAYDTAYTVSSTNYPDLIIYIRLFVNPGAVGDLRFLVVSDQGDSLENAQIQLYSQVYDPNTSSYPVYHDVTYAGGVCNFLSQPANSYSYKVSADGYLSKVGQVFVSPGQTLDDFLTISLEPQQIEMIWVVIETQVEDVYDVTLEITYDPSELSPPLLIVRPHVIVQSFDYDNLMPVLGEFSLLNAGEMTANDVVILWPNNRYFSVQVNTHNGLLPDAVLDGLQPGESVVIPYAINFKNDVEKCGKYESMFEVIGSYGSEGNSGEVRTFGKFVVGDKSCNYDIRLEPWPLVFVTIPCLFTGTCECDLSSFFTSEAVELRAINVGEGVATLTNAVPLRVGIPGLSLSLESLVPGGWAMKQYYNNLLTVAASAGFEWIPSRTIASGETATTSVFLVSLPTGVGGILELGVVLVGASWPNYETVLWDPLVHIGITDMQLGRLLYCIVKDISLGYGGTSWGSVGWYGGFGGFPAGSPFQSLPGPETPQADEGGLIKIVIEQQMSLERQGFNAYLEILNGFESYSIDDIDVDVEVKDVDGAILAPDQYASGNPLFFSLTDLEGISNIDGSGSIAAQSSGKAGWLIIPKTDAGGSSAEGRKYYLTANVTYKIGGVEYTYSTQSEQITVLPQPLLNLTYFIPQYFADNVPFKLALKIDNVGAGTAKNLRMDSDQPVAVQCADLVERWEITGSYIEGEPESPSLLLNFGDLAPAASKTGYWTIEAAPGGEIVEFTASFEHDDELGGLSTSLINEVNTYIIISDDLTVDQDMPPGKRYVDPNNDFAGILVDQNRDNKPDLVFNLVDGEQFNVTVTLPTSVEEPTFANPVMKVYTPCIDGWIYFTVNDPFLGTENIVNISRQDGSILPTSNYWLDSGYVHICDNPYNSEFYAIQFGDISYKPDLAIADYNISIQPCDGCGEIDAGDALVTIDMTISNMGQRDVDSVLVHLYDGSPSTGIVIDSFYIDSLHIDESVIHSIDWITGPPSQWVLFYHRVYVVIDPYMLINEASRENNSASAGVDFALTVGDCNHSGSVNIADVVYLVNYLFLQGPEPCPADAANVNCSDEINVGDVVYMLNYIFGGGDLCDPRLPGQKLAPQKSAELYLASIPVSGRELMLTLSGTFECDLAGIQFELDIAGSHLLVTGVTAGNATEGIPCYYSHSDSSLIVGFVDIRERRLISKDGGELLKIKFVTTGTDRPILDKLKVKNVVLVDEDGQELRVDLEIDWVEHNIPKTFFLAQNYPNPFNPTTVIEFGLPKPCHVKLKVINILGQTVKTLLDDDLDSGYKRVIWDGTNSANDAVASGVYFYQLEAGDYSGVKKMVIIK